MYGLEERLRARAEWQTAGARSGASDSVRADVSAFGDWHHRREFSRGERAGGRKPRHASGSLGEENATEENAHACRGQTLSGAGVPSGTQSAITPSAAHPEDYHRPAPRAAQPGHRWPSRSAWPRLPLRPKGLSSRRGHADRFLYCFCTTRKGTFLMSVDTCADLCGKALDRLAVGEVAFFRFVIGLVFVVPPPAGDGVLRLVPD
jgi:hypothetical protein